MLSCLSTPTLAFTSSIIARGFASAAVPKLIEVREYTLKPEGFKDFLKISNQNAELRKSLLPFLGMFTCETGGTLNKLTHFYHYNDMESRKEIRDRAGSNADWVKYVDLSRDHVAHQESKIMVEATPIYEALNIPSTASFAPNKAADGKALYELRNYQLHPGYGSVPKLIDAFTKGLPEKVQSDPDGQLVFFGYTDVGLLNNVIELWRYPSAQACIQARQAARKVQKWKDTIAAVTPNVQTFQTSFLHPTSFSPWQ